MVWLPRLLQNPSLILTNQSSLFYSLSALACTGRFRGAACGGQQPQRLCGRRQLHGAVCAAAGRRRRLVRKVRMFCTMPILQCPRCTQCKLVTTATSEQFAQQPADDDALPERRGCSPQRRYPRCAQCKLLTTAASWGSSRSSRPATTPRPPGANCNPPPSSSSLKCMLAPSPSSQPGWLWLELLRQAQFLHRNAKRLSPRDP